MFLTNNSSHNANHYVKKLAKMGIHVGPEKVLTSGQATALKARTLFPGKKAFVLGNSFLFEELRDGGIEIDQENPDYVIIGYDTTLDYAKMTAVCDFVQTARTSPRHSASSRAPMYPKRCAAISWRSAKRAANCPPCAWASVPAACWHCFALLRRWRSFAVVISSPPTM